MQPKVRKKKFAKNLIYIYLLLKNLNRTLLVSLQVSPDKLESDSTALWQWIMNNFACQGCEERLLSKSNLWHPQKLQVLTIQIYIVLHMQRHCVNM